MGSSCCAAGQTPVQSHLSSEKSPTCVRREGEQLAEPSGCQVITTLKTLLSPVSYRQRLTRPLLQGNPVLLCSCSFILPLMKLFKYSSVCTQRSSSSEAISGTHTYCEEGKSHQQEKEQRIFITSALQLTMTSLSLKGTVHPKRVLMFSEVG